MIATILPSSSTFHAVEYNERKVAKGHAQLLEMSNFGFVGQISPYTPEELKNYLKQYTEDRNRRIKRPQFHVAISCRGDECSEEQLVRIAHDYLREMGYDNPGQPLLIYGHHDTDNNHIHIITSRIAPDGHKVDHNHEKRRSLNAINKIMQVDDNKELSDLIKDAGRYYYTTTQQYMAIFETSGYECYEEDGKINLKRGGIVLRTIDIPKIDSNGRKPGNYEYRKRMIRAWLLKYRDYVSCKEELAEVINRKFKVGIKFVGSKDSPYGYMVVDHKAGIVYKGSEIAQLRNLLNFETAEDRFNRFDQFVSRMLDENKGLTTKELNKMLRRQFSQTISRSGHIAWNMQEHQMPESIMTILKENDRVAWLQSFHPSNEIERAILCKLGTGCNQENLHLETPELKNTEHTVEHLKSIINSEFEESLAQRMFRDGLLAYHVGDKYYCLDVRHKTILCMDDFGIDTSKFKSNTKSEVQDKPVVRKPLENMNVGATAHQAVNGLSRVLNQNAGSHNGNREWEVGKHNNYEDIDDERGLKR